MKTIYAVGGMTCGNCKKSVEDALRAIDTSSAVSVSLENGTVEIQSALKPELKELQSALGATAVPTFYTALWPSRCS